MEKLVLKKGKCRLMFYVKGKTGSYQILYLGISLLELLQSDALIPRSDSPIPGILVLKNNGQGRSEGSDQSPVAPCFPLRALTGLPSEKLVLLRELGLYDQPKYLLSTIRLLCSGSQEKYLFGV